MSKYYTTINTKENGRQELGWITAQNGWHAMAIAKKIAQKKGLTVIGTDACSYCVGK